MSSQSGPVSQIIAAKLTEKFQPIHLDVINESHMHNVPKGIVDYLPLFAYEKK